MFINMVKIYLFISMFKINMVIYMCNGFLRVIDKVAYFTTWRTRITLILLRGKRLRFMT